MHIYDDIQGHLQTPKENVVSVCSIFWLQRSYESPHQDKSNETPSG